MMTSFVVKQANIAGGDAPGRKEFGIFARRAMVDQAREGLCYQ